MHSYYQKTIVNAEIRHPLDKGAVRRLSVAITAGALLVCGFVYAIWQHVEAVSYGYRTEQLRFERERLDAEKRKLELERAFRRSPEAIELAARGLGLVRPDASQVVVANRGRAQGQRRKESSKSAAPRRPRP